jgi:hypothetical protein
MKIQHITFSSDNMSISARRCSESALMFGCDSSRIFTHDDIDPEFYNENRLTLSQERGAGYWLWKPYIIDRSLSKSDLLIYTDAGLLFENDIMLLLEQKKDDIMVFGNRWRHGDWCKMDVLRGMDCERFADGEQLQASCIILRNNNYTRNTIKLWLHYSQLPGWIDDSPSKLPNQSGFREHRHDQAILTNLAYLYNLPFHWWPVQYNVRHRKKYTETYPIIFQHHRKRNNEWDQ